MARDYSKSEKTIKAFLQNAKIVDIARAAGLSRSTIYKLQKDSAFQEVLAERRAALVQAATDEMRSNILKDVRILQGVIESPDTPAGTKVYGIQVMLTQLGNLISFTEFENRLQRLEKTKIGDFSQF